METGVTVTQVFGRRFLNSWHFTLLKFDQRAFVGRQQRHFRARTLHLEDIVQQLRVYA